MIFNVHLYSIIRYSFKLFGFSLQNVFDKADAFLTSFLIILLGRRINIAAILRRKIPINLSKIIYHVTWLLHKRFALNDDFPTLVISRTSLSSKTRSRCIETCVLHARACTRTIRLNDEDGCETRLRKRDLTAQEPRASEGRWCGLANRRASHKATRHD